MAPRAPDIRLASRDRRAPRGARRRRRPPRCSRQPFRPRPSRREYHPRGMRVTELTDFVVSLVACAAFVAITVLAASRGKRDPLARLLALLCVDLVLYSSSEAIGVLGNHHGKLLWDWINDVSACEAPPL